VQADLSQRSGPAALASEFTQELIARFGVPDFDILVNNAGAGKRVPIEQISEDDFGHILTVNLQQPSDHGTLLWLIRGGLRW
jgi:3-oxoacyl-[acyl-carrier protein] reductase